MSNFFPSLFRWMTASSSIIGAAVATPSVIGALTGQVSWTQAALPLIGAAVAILMPQTTSPLEPNIPAAPVSAGDAIKAMLGAASQAAELSPSLNVHKAVIAANAAAAVATAAYSEYQSAMAAVAKLVPPTPPTPAPVPLPTPAPYVPVAQNQGAGA